MNPDMWGPKAWFFIHSVTFSYPIKPTSDDISSMKQFIQSIGDWLPCILCKRHYLKRLEEIDLKSATSSRISLIKFFIDIHNEINLINGKRAYTYKEVTELYQKHYMGSNNDKMKHRIIGMIVIMFILFTLYLTGCFERF